MQAISSLCDVFVVSRMFFTYSYVEDLVAGSTKTKKSFQFTSILQLGT
mgnify:CR=1 FL=1